MGFNKVALWSTSVLPSLCDLTQKRVVKSMKMTPRFLEFYTFLYALFCFLEWVSIPNKFGILDQCYKKSKDPLVYMVNLN